MNHNQQQQHLQPNMQTGSGLTRYRSAPSSYFAGFLDNNNANSSSSGFGPDDFERLFNPRASSPETQRIFSRFMNNSDMLQENHSSNVSVHPPSQLQQPQLNPSFLQPTKIESEVVPQTQLQRQQSNDFPSVSMYPTRNHETTSSVMDKSYNGLLGSVNSNRLGPGGGGGGGPGLIRHSSSPAGLFANIDIERELAAMRGMGSFGGGNSGNAEASFSSASRFSSRISSSSGMMAPISEIGSKGIGENIQGDEGQFDEDHVNTGDHISDFPIDSWDDSAILSDNFLNELVENETKPFSNPNALNDPKNTETMHRPRTLLSHHLSLPKNTAALSAVENFLQDSVPCKIRAKRGCATHPRSIAERVRRTKISQRMRKLQELVPNMEKQTNTSDMLDLAVDYIKDLQREVKKLSDSRARCSCLAKELS